MQAVGLVLLVHVVFSLSNSKANYTIAACLLEEIKREDGAHYPMILMQKDDGACVAVSFLKTLFCFSCSCV